MNSCGWPGGSAEITESGTENTHYTVEAHIRQQSPVQSPALLGSAIVSGSSVEAYND